MARRRTGSSDAIASAKPTKASPTIPASPSAASVHGVQVTGAGNQQNLPPPPMPGMSLANVTGGLAPNPLAPTQTATVPWTETIGQTGLKRPPWRGQVYEEFLSELSGRRGVQVYREMRDNDSVIGAVMYSVEAMLRAVEWRVEGENEADVEFVEQCLADMRPNFALTINEILSMLTYGWSVHEVVYKVRGGPTLDPLTSSNFDDGRLGWQGWPIRSQDSLFGWDWDSRGQTLNMLQQAPPFFVMTAVPLNRCLHFRTTTMKDNPEGRSMLRSAYRSWWFRRNIQTLESIGIERDLAGLPMIERAEQYSSLDPAFQRILRNVRQDEQGGIVMPLVYDERGNKLIEFKLLSASGSKQFNTSEVLDRYGREMAMVMLSDFLMLGHESVGSFALSSSKTQMFSRALKAVLENIASVINEEAIPRLFAVNGLPLVDLPKIAYGDLETPDLTELGAFLQSAASSGVLFGPDEDLENYIRRAASLPERSEELSAQLEEQRQQMADIRAQGATPEPPEDDADENT